MEIRKDIAKIGENRKVEDMEKLADMLTELICMTKDSHPELFDKYSMEIYEMANGKTLTKDIAEEWVEDMEPAGKWDFATTSTVRKQRNISDIDEISFYVVMNMLYSDMSDILGTGDDVESINNYIQATRNWLNDKDTASDKLYNYWRYVVQ